MSSLYSRIPGFIKGIWRGRKIESYISYSGNDTGILYEHANVLKKLARNGGEGETYSQYAQDWFIFNFIFHTKESGFFLDIGANDPIRINNTLLFEKHGWKGLAFEPQKKLAEKWSERKADCINIALGDVEKKIYFREENEHELSRVVKNKKQATTVVKQRKLMDVLDERQIRAIDFISLDVEGYEYYVLKGIDFSKVDVGVILMEISDSEIAATRRTRSYLRKNGFVMIARLQIDDVWVNQKFFDN